MDDYFPTMAMKPNPQCSNNHCLRRQEEYTKYLEAHPLEEDKSKQVLEEVVHEDNDWGKDITLLLAFYGSFRSNVRNENPLLANCS